MGVCQQFEGWKRTMQEVISEIGFTSRVSNNARPRVPAHYLRMPSLEMTVLYRSESYFFR
jgi:hypothetical protein